jgi:hypothetical protein
VSIIKACPSCFNVHDWSKPCPKTDVKEARKLFKQGKLQIHPRSAKIGTRSSRKPNLDYYDRKAR